MQLKNIFLLSLMILLITGCKGGAPESVLAVFSGNTDSSGNLLVNVTTPIGEPRVETPLLVYAVSATGAPTTLQNTTHVDSYEINVTGGLWVIGDHLQITSATAGRFYRGTVLNVNGDILTMDTPIDFMFVAGDIILGIEDNLAVDGSVTPVIYQVGPVGQEVEAFVSRIIPHCIDNAAADDSKFCGGPPLTRGLVMRYGDGEKYNIFNIKTNGDLVKLAYDVTYSDKAGAGNYGMGSRLTFAGDSKQGTYLYVYNTTILEFIVQDDMTNLIEFTVTTEGFFRAVQ